jgi:xylose dehydrogenase (NAD/NADP)
MKHSTKVRWGLLSTAHINRRLIPAIRASKRGELVAVASRSLSKAEKYAANWNIPVAFGSYQDMLDSGQIDIAYISLPNHLHAEWSIRALQAGVHVLCEKPFAITLDQVDQMIETSRQTGIVLAEAFMYRHHSQTKLVGEWVRSGRLGEISLVAGMFNYKNKDPKDVRLTPEYGGGCLWDVGVYPLSFAQYVFGGPPDAVIGMQWTGDTGVDETFAGQLHYPGDRLAQIASSFRTEFQTQMEITGTEGRLNLSRPFTTMDEGRHLIFFPNQGKAEELRVPKAELYAGEVEDMHSAVLDHTPNYLTLQETRDHIRTVLALYKSATTGQLVNL